MLFHTGRVIRHVAVAAFCGMSIGSYAADVPDITQRSGVDEYVMSAPPRETPEEALRTYKPIADYLSKVTGKKIVYRWPRTWGLYRTKMVTDSIDIAFDGPHF